MATTNQARLPATAEFDAKLAKMYDKALTEVQRALRKNIGKIKLDINKILLPTTSEQEEARIARAFTKKRLKILDSMDMFVRNLVIGRNRVSLFDMFDENNPMSKSYARRYNRVKMQALARLETGVSLIKFERDQDLPLATILFPSRNTKLYTLRYELLKHMLLTKVNKGIRNLSFVSETWWGRVKKKITLEKTKAEVPIDAFLIPTPNSNFFTLRYNWSKHVLLTKVHKGIKNLQFVATEAKEYTRLNRSTGTKMKPIKTQMQVPLDSFLFPTGNTWLYAARYELAKWKLLGKIKKGINNLKFEGGTFNVMDKFMPDSVDDMTVSNVIGKAIAKSISRESKTRSQVARRNAKTNEYQVHKQEQRLDKWMELDAERNRIMMEAFFGRGGGKTTNMRQGSDGVWRQGGGLGGLLSGTSGGVAGALATKAGTLIKGPGGKALGVVAAGAIGYGIGRWLDNQLQISDAAGKISGAVTGYFDDKDYVKNTVNPSLENNPWVSKYYREFTGGDTKQSTTEKIHVYEQAMHRARLKMIERKNALDAAGVEYSKADLNSLKPIDYIIKTARGEPIEMHPTVPQTPAMTDYFMQGSSTVNTISSAQADMMISGLNSINANIQRGQGSVIINQRANPNENLGVTLDIPFYIEN